jgi:signal transduction histidine kinase/HAMP domain-containing protein
MRATWAGSSALPFTADASARSRQGAIMLQTFSIKTRLLFLSGTLLAIIAGATYYLTTKLAENSRAITRNAELAELIDIAQDVRNIFGQYRYWTTDLAVSLLRQSEVNANATRDRLLRRLDDLALRKPDVAAALKEQIGEFENAAMKAVEQYTDDQRVLGNTFLAQARQHSVVINDRLSALVDDLNHEVVRARDQVVADITQATQIAYVFVVVAILLGIATTLVVLRSILVPLRQVISAMDGITAGDLNTPIPPASGDEIGVMTKTLRLFSGSIVERTRLYVFDERQRELKLRATYGMDRELIDALTQRRIGLDDPNVVQALTQPEPIQVADLRDETPNEINEITLRAGFRARLVAPLMRGEDVVGLLVVRRRAPGAFPQNTVDLIKTFAAQSVLAIQNARLFENVEARTRELARSLVDLRTAQDRLVQTEKLASLGQLTAGIAHEIKNPLNFVNNFSAVSVELIDELREALGSAHLDSKLRAEIGEIADTLQGNLDKVVQHGKRADAIVKNMLLHSRQGSGEHRPVEINALVDESLNLAYHGARAEKQGFTITLERSFDPAAGEVDLFPQEITRALLNLISNGFYATTKRKAEANGGDYEPTLAAATKNLSDRVEIRIRDNGTGIPPEVRGKLFNPFFTTKPAGEGTGLGLSISHDIIVKQHGGSIEVDTVPGEFTEFRIILPRAGASPIRSG